jgi:outer membrane biogenesis lipoprotein LolB
MRLLPALAALALLSGCGGSGETSAAVNEAGRIEGDLQRQVRRISEQAENGAAQIEQALENEGAAVFANRGNPFNETAAAPADPELEKAEASR